ncbi:MAG: ATP-binding protein [Mariprofundus sp.]|nr:ATP-binding protein [Mariprofundus sp.]
MQFENIPLSILPLPMLLLDNKAQVLQSNLLAEEALCKSNRRLCGRHLTDVFSPAVEVERLLSLLSPYSGGVSNHQLCMLDSGMPVSLHLGMHENGLTVIFVPEAHRTEVERHAKRHEMAEAVARIALEMAHEVKNPLTALRGASQWLSEQNINADAREAVAQMIHSVDRIRDRIDAFLQVGPRAPVQMEMTNLHVLIQDIIQYPDGIYISRVFDPSLPDILAHPDRLRQALENLWQNALEAAESKIEWQTRMAPLVHLPGHQGKVVEVSITNDGAMIPEALQDRLFEPFVTGKKRGSGLGLAQVERVMLEHGGRVNVDSGNGRTTMTLQLPVKITTSVKTGGEGKL